MLNVFIGYDKSEDVAWEVCKYSIERHVMFDDVRIHKLCGNPNGWERTGAGGQSTDFTYSRFLVPYLSNYEGTSVFVDCDFIFTQDISLLRNYLMDAPVACCQHPRYRPHTNIKMDNQKQISYHRKNWSSLMIFNNEKCVNLTPEYVAEAKPAELHQMVWANSIDSIPLDWNVLEGYYHLEAPNAIHFTDGGPWHHSYQPQRYTQYWLDYYHEWKRTNNINHVL